MPQATGEHRCSTSMLANHDRVLDGGHRPAPSVLTVDASPGTSRTASPFSLSAVEPLSPATTTSRSGRSWEVADLVSALITRSRASPSTDVDDGLGRRRRTARPGRLGAGCSSVVRGEWLRVARRSRRRSPGPARALKLRAVLVSGHGHEDGRRSPLAVAEEGRRLDGPHVRRRAATSSIWSEDEVFSASARTSPGRHREDAGLAGPQRPAAGRPDRVRGAALVEDRALEERGRRTRSSVGSRSACG